MATVDEQSGPDFESEGLTRPRDTSAVVAVHPRTDELVPVARAPARFDPVEILIEKDTGDLYLAATVPLRTTSSLALANFSVSVSGVSKPNP